MLPSYVNPQRPAVPLLIFNLRLKIGTFVVKVEKAGVAEEGLEAGVKQGGVRADEGVEKLAVGFDEGG